MNVKQLSIIVFSFLLFFGSTGVLVFHHHCKIQGDFLSVFLPIDHDCNEKTDEKICNASSCCTNAVSSSETDSFFSETKCCSDGIDFIVIDSDLNKHENDLQIVNLINPLFISCESAVLLIKDTDNLDYKDPPYFYKRSEHLSLLQSYLI